MDIELIRRLGKFTAGNVLHIGEDNIKFWLESYKNSMFKKIFWAAPNFYSRGYDLSAIERATVEVYRNPWYYFVKCRIKDDKTLTNGLDDSYSSDFDFRMSFNNEQITAIVIDEKPLNKEHIKIFLERAKNTIGLCKPEIVYVRSDLEDIVKTIVEENNLFPEYSFDVSMSKTINGMGIGNCRFSAYVKR